MSSVDQILAKELSDLAEHNNLRKLRRVDERLGPVVEINGRSLVDFGSNDYLGLSGHPAVIAAAKDGAGSGSGSTGSRLTTGNAAIHEQLEAKIARFKHSQAALLFGSGYAANVGAIPALVGKGDLILSDELNHASIIDGCRLSRAETRVYHHSDVDHLDELLSDRHLFRRTLVVTDGVFSMDGDLARLPEIVDICERTHSWLMVDDAHGTGVFGETGTGTLEHFGVSEGVDIQMGTLSKAVGCSGGFIAGSSELIEFLRNKARSFVYSTAPTPSNSYAALTALDLIQRMPELRAKHRDNIVRLRFGLKKLGVEALPGISPIIPIVIGSSKNAVALSAHLESAGLWVPAIRPPTVPEGSSRLRITITTSHNEEQIDLLMNALSSALRSTEASARL
jgi:8-amino-7-oxononanoate synthase